MQKKKSQNAIVIVALCLILVYVLAYSIQSLDTNLPATYFTLGDDATYVYFAQQALAGQFHELHFIYSLRLMQIFPIAFFIGVFGNSIYAYSAWDIFAFLGSVVAVFLLCRKLYNAYSGILAAVLLSVFPLMALLGYATNPDGPQIFVTCLVLLLLAYSRERRYEKLGFLCGVLLVAAPLITTTGVILLVITAVYLCADYLLSSRKPKVFVRYLVLGFIAASALVVAYNFINTGDPLYTIDATHGYYSSNNCGSAQNTTLDVAMFEKFAIQFSCNEILGPASRSVLAYLYIMFPYNLASPLTVLYQYNHVGLFFYVLVLAVSYLLFKREKKAYYLIYFFAAALLFLSTGPLSISLSPPGYSMVPVVWRYLTLLAIPTIALISIALARFVDSGKGSGKRFRLMLVCLLVILLLVSSLLIDIYVSLT